MTGSAHNRLSGLRERELQRFAQLRPLGVRQLETSRALMPNGVPSAWMATLYDHPPIVVERGFGGAFTLHEVGL